MLRSWEFENYLSAKWYQLQSGYRGVNINREKLNGKFLRIMLKNMIKGCKIKFKIYKQLRKKNLYEKFSSCFNFSLKIHMH